MLHRFYTRRSFFRRHFAEYFGTGPLAESYPYYYWFLTTAVTLLIIPILVAKFGTREKLSDYGIQLGNQQLGWRVTGNRMDSDDSSGYPCRHRISAICRKISALQGRRKQLASIFALSTRVWCLHVFVGIFLPRVYAVRIGTEIWELCYFNSGRFRLLSLHYTKPLPEALGSIIAGVLLGVLAFETRSFLYGAVIHLARCNDDGCSGCRFSAFFLCENSIADAQQLCYNFV